MNNFLDFFQVQLKNDFLSSFILTLEKGVNYYEVVNNAKTNGNIPRGCYSWVDADGKKMVFTKLTQIKFENEYIVYMNNKSTKLFDLLKGE